MSTAPFTPEQEERIRAIVRDEMARADAERAFDPPPPPRKPGEPSHFIKGLTPGTPEHRKIFGD